MALDVWQTLPIGIFSALKDHDPDEGDAIIGALEHCEPISEIFLLGLSGAQLESCAALMQETFPILRTLRLSLRDDDAKTPLVISDAFLGGCAPRLRNFNLCHIPFPTLPRLLLSASHLIELHLEEIPNTRYISPEAMATCLTALTRLQYVTIGSQFWTSFPPNQTNQHPPPMTRAVLPSLTKFTFGCVSGEYLDDLMARIHLPLLNHLHLKFFHQHTLGIPKLPQIIHRIETFKPPFEADVHFYDDGTDMSFSSQVGGRLRLESQRTELDSQLSWLKGIYPQFLTLLSKINHLKLVDHDMQDEQDSTPWLEFLQPFSAVQTLFIYDQNSLKQVVRVLGELTDERAGEVLPMLDAIVFFDKSIWDQVRSWLFPLVQPFVDARQLSGRPVVVR